MVVIISIPYIWNWLKLDNIRRKVVDVPTSSKAILSGKHISQFSLIIEMLKHSETLS